MISDITDILDSTINFVKQMVVDLSEQQLVEQPPGIPCHGMWTLGHIIFSCHEMAVEFGSDRWLSADWESVFGYGSTPSPDKNFYQKKSEMLSHLSESKTHLCATLLAADQSKFEKKISDEQFPTMNHLLLQVVIAHTAFHTGQLAMWRRAIGKPSVGVFV